MKQLITSLLFFLTFSSLIAQSTEDYKFYQLASLSGNVNSELKSKIIDDYFSSTATTDGLVGNNDFDLENMQLGIFDSTDLQAVYIKGINSSTGKMIIVYVKGNLVSDMAMKLDYLISRSGDTTILVKDHLGGTVFDLKVESNGTLQVELNPDWEYRDNAMNNINFNDSFVKGGPSNKDENLKAFWDRWTSCVSTGLSQLFGGQHGVYVMIAGVWCVANGPYCAGGAVIGCLGHAAVFH